MEGIKNKIYSIRGFQVILDSDLADLYKVETKYLNKTVRRNITRFPESFMFQLTEEEYNSLRFQIGTLRSAGSLRSQFVTLDKSRGKHRKYLPYVFTEQGVSMLSAVLRSKKAIEVSIQIINAFVNMRKFFAENATLFTRIDNIERKQITYDKHFELIFEAIEDKTIKKKQGIFFDGQVFDAHKFICDLIRSANESIILFSLPYFTSIIIIKHSRSFFLYGKSVFY